MNHPTTHMAQLPFLARRLLRIIAQHGPIATAELYQLSELKALFSTTATSLILHGLVSKCMTTNTYNVTPAGAQVVAREQGVNRVQLHNPELLEAA